MYFNMRDTSGLDNSSYNLPSNVHVCTGPDDSLGSDYSINLVSLQGVIKQLVGHAMTGWESQQKGSKTQLGDDILIWIIMLCFLFSVLCCSYGLLITLGSRIYPDTYLCISKCRLRHLNQKIPKWPPCSSHLTYICLIFVTTKEWHRIKQWYSEHCSTLNI